MSLQELRNELRDLRELRPELHEPELFVLWFVMSALGENDPGAAAAALVGGAGDKGVDAVYIDHDSASVSIVQGKFSTATKGSEALADVVAFASLSPTLFDDEKYKAWTMKALPTTATRMKKARQLLLRRGYRLNLYYATTRACSQTAEQQASRLARADRVQLTIYQRRDVDRLIRDYLDGVAPPVPRVELPIETAPASGYIKRHDPKTEITSWIVSVRANEVAKLYEQHGDKIFARNIRGYLGSGDAKSVNAAIAHTLSADPAHFWYFNNGVTIACDDAQKVERGGKDVLQIDNPQIVNGQQTTRTLAEEGGTAKAGVLVRVTALPRGELRLVDDIVKATNNQNPIRASDLMANDRVQVFLERKLLLRGYQYLRKRAQKSEARAAAKVKPKFQVKKEELAQAVASCEEEPTIVYSAKEKLFEDEIYERLFRKESISFYLTRYWLLRTVRRRLWGSGHETAYMKFFVTHAVWDRNGSILTKYADEFIRCAESSFGGAEDGSLAVLEASIDKTYDAFERFYRQTRSNDDTVYSFFKRVKQYDLYVDFMSEPRQAVLRSKIDRSDEECRRHSHRSPADRVG
jgi:hypothetical protein